MAEQRSPKPPVGGSNPSWPADKLGKHEIMNKVAKFITEVKTELKKVSWPTKSELINSTIVVIVAVVIMAIFIGLCDVVLSNAINFILR